MCEPVVPFIYIRITKPCLHTYGQSSCFCCLYQFCCNFRTTNKTASHSIRCYIRCRTAHIDIHTPKSFFCPTNIHLSKVFTLIPPYMGHTGLFVFCDSQSASDTAFSFLGAIPVRMWKLCTTHLM